jgi:hypothetical protein
LRMNRPSIYMIVAALREEFGRLVFTRPDLPSASSLG